MPTTKTAIQPSKVSVSKGQFPTSSAFASWFIRQMGRKHCAFLNGLDLWERLNILVGDMERLTRRTEACLEQAYDPATYGLWRAVQSGRCCTEVEGKLRALNVRDLLKVIHELMCFDYDVETYAGYLSKKFRSQEQEQEQE